VGSLERNRKLLMIKGGQDSRFSLCLGVTESRHADLLSTVILDCGTGDQSHSVMQGFVV
jgi:hypothetical protein